MEKGIMSRIPLPSGQLFILLTSYTTSYIKHIHNTALALNIR